MAAVCVFCGSRKGARPGFESATAELGRLLVERGHGLVYGGGSIGLMGVCADAVLAHGGEVLGVIPTFLDRVEIAHEGLQRMEVTSGMMPRKELMIEASDGFIALPGGLGTLDEMLEVLTWKQLGQLHGPIGLLDVEGFFQPWLALIDHLVREEFLGPEARELLVIDETPSGLLDAMGL